MRRARAALLLLVGAFGAPAAFAAADARVHQVRSGETLSQIALVTWGDPSLWPALYLANRDRIKDPALVYPGQELAIPELEPEEREALRREARAHLTR